MSRCLLIRPIGFVEEDTLEDIAASIKIRCGMDCVISSAMENPVYAFNESRCQYNSKLILKNMIKCCPQDVLGFMGVTHVDMFVPILKYVFGLSQVEDRCSLISTHRLDPRFYNHEPDPDLLMARLEKTALHELGHSFGLTHCRNRRCVMYSSTRVEHTDAKQPDLCPTCLELLRWHIKNP